jgi:hypothetical protein
MPSLRNIILFLLIAGTIFSVYFFFLKPDAPKENLVTTSGVTTSFPTTEVPGDFAPNPTTIVDAKDFLTLLLNVRNIKLNDGIFLDPAYQSLRDSSIELIPDNNPGRVNPFAQFGNDPVSPDVESTPPEDPIDPNLPPPQL